MVSFKKLFSLALAAVAAADSGIVIFHKEEIALYACSALLENTVYYFGTYWAGVMAVGENGGFCNLGQQQAIGSMAHCLRSLPTNHGISAFLESCSEYNVTMQDFDDAYNNATQYLVSNVTGYPGFNSKEVFYLPVKVDQDRIDGAWRSAVARYYNKNRANYYGIALIAYWFLLIGFAGVIRLASAVAPKKVNCFNGRVSNAYKKYVTMAPLGKKKVVTHGRIFTSFEFVIPTRIETIYLVGWFAMALAFNVADFHHEAPNVYFPNRAAEMGREVSDRSGIIVLYLIPQFLLFAGRNNFLQWVSGWSFARFNLIHRWMGRVSLALMVTHAVAMTVDSLALGKFDTRNDEPFVQWGYVAVIIAGLMCFHSLAYFRKNCYEFFVLSHNVMGVIFVAGVWLHVAEDRFQQIMYAAVAVWCFDKSLRLVRMCWFGVKTAEVQLIARETLKVKVPRPVSWKPHPLAHAYIYFLRGSCFWQSHPFTVVDSVVEENVVCFYIKVKGGMSNSLYQFLSTQPDNRASIKCTVEGPYGNAVSLQHYDTVSYLSGGNGVPGPFSSAIHLAQRHSTQKLKLYWVIRHWKTIEWFYEELKALEATNVQAVVYVTQFNTPLDESFVDKFSGESDVSTEKNSEKDAELELASENATRLMENLHFIEFRTGRPNIQAIVKQDICESSGAAAFVACGHDQFVDSSRKVVIESLEDGKRVDFYDLMEMW